METALIFYAGGIVASFMPLMFTCDSMGGGYVKWRAFACALVWPLTALALVLDVVEGNG